MKKKEIFLILALVFVFALVFSPHLGYRYPFHIDEWHHIEFALKLAEGKRIEFMEIGFDFFLAVISKFANLVKISIFLPALCAVISSIILFYYLNKRFDFITGIMAVLLFASLSSNVNILGLWFFTPLTMAIPLVYLALFIFEEALIENNKKKLITGFVINAATFTIHPPSALIALIGEILLALKERRLIKEKKNLIYLLILIIPVILYFILSWKGSFLNTIKFFLQYIYLTEEFTVFLININPILLFGIVPSLLAIIGLTKGFKIKKLQQFSFILIFTIINLIIFAVFRITFVAHYQRTIYHLVLSAVPLSAFGFSIVYKTIKRAAVDKILKIILLIILVILTLIPSYLNYYKIEEKAKLYILLDPEEAPALEFVKTLPDPTIMITPGRIGNVLYPLAKKEPIASVYWHELDKNEKIKNFYKGDCTNKKELIEEFSANYVFSINETNCSFLIPIYQNNISNVSIYSVNFSNQNT